MHELSVTENILNIVIDAAQKNGARRITAIHLVIGELSSIVDDSVQFYFDLISKGTLAENAVLHFRRESAVVVCLDCAQQFHARVPLEPRCSACGSARVQVRGGREFFIESIEVEDEDSRR